MQNIQTYRWEDKGYSHYRLVLWASMMNDMSIIFAATEMAHSLFYIHTVAYVITVIFGGIPLLYSEICIAQYTNSGFINMWDVFPFFKGFGYGSILLLVYKSMFTLTMSTWYLRYTFYAAMNPPPWYSCADFPECRCMVKRVNKSIFQHCIEAQFVHEDDCGVKTASNCFFTRELGGKNTVQSLDCMIPWKSLAAAICIIVMVYLLAIRKGKFLAIGVKINIVYIICVMLAFCCSAFWTSQGWIDPSGKASSNNGIEYKQLFQTSMRAFLSLGTGTGIVFMLTRDVPFRSPAIMTAIVTALLSAFGTFLFALVAYSAIMITFYFHGQVGQIIEIGDSIFFEQLGSVSEILMYLEPGTMWGFAWFSSMFFCLFINFWLIILILSDLLHRHVGFVKKYEYLSRCFIVVTLLLVTCPFFCSDLGAALADAVESIQLISSLAISVTLYWIYGYKAHSIDIIFMIGIKSSYFWKITWILNPVFLLIMVGIKFSSLYVNEEDFTLNSLNDICVYFGLLGLYIFVVLLVMCIDVIKYIYNGRFTKLFEPKESWGPRDKVLFKSRQMFRPEIMTREFLYRQVRLYGYEKTRTNEQQVEEHKNEMQSEESCHMEWSALTSN